MYGGLTVYVGYRWCLGVRPRGRSPRSQTVDGARSEEGGARSVAAAGSLDGQSMRPPAVTPLPKMYRNNPVRGLVALRGCGGCFGSLLEIHLSSRVIQCCSLFFRGSACSRGPPTTYNRDGLSPLDRIRPWRPPKVLSGPSRAGPDDKKCIFKVWRPARQSWLLSFRF